MGRPALGHIPTLAEAIGLTLAIVGLLVTVAHGVPPDSRSSQTWKIMNSKPIKIPGPDHPRLENIAGAGVPIAEFHYAEKAWLRKERGTRRIEKRKGKSFTDEQPGRNSAGVRGSSAWVHRRLDPPFDDEIARSACEMAVYAEYNSCR